MNRVIKTLIAALLALIFMAGCAGGAGGSGETSEELVPAETTVAVCIGAMNNPVHRVVEMAFLTKAEELGYNAIIAGLDEGSQQELIAKFESAVTNGAKGVMIWTSDDSMYTMMRGHAGECVFVVPHFAHEYADTHEFIARNICCLAAEYGREVARFMVDRLEEDGITSGTLGLTQSGSNVTENAAADAFRDEIRVLGVDFTVADTIFEGGEVTSAANKVTGVIQSNPDIVGAFGTTGTSCQSWSSAMENTGRTDLVVVAMDYTEINQDLVQDGVIAAIVAAPLYDEAQESAVTLDAIFKGADYSASESEWFLTLDAPLAYAGGEGENDIDHYRPIAEAVIEYFST